MTEHNDERTQEKEPYTPASFEKRAAAWVGIVYVLMLLGILWFALFFPGRSLSGTFPLFLTPICAAVVAVAARRLRKGTAPGGPVAGWLALIAAAGAGIFGLLLGLPALIAAFAG